MNVVADGVYLSDPADVVDHVTRGLYQFSSYVLRGLPPGWKVKQDLEVFLRTVTFTYEGQTVNPRPWPLGRDGPPLFEGMPGFNVDDSSGAGATSSTSTDRNRNRQAAFFKFAEQEHKAGRLIPLVAEDYKGPFNPSALVLDPIVPTDAIGLLLVAKYCAAY